MLVANFDDMKFLEADLEDMYKGTDYEKQKGVSAVQAGPAVI
jgi:hypothetical protein